VVAFPGVRVSIKWRALTTTDWSLRRRLGVALLVASMLIVGVVAASGILLVQARDRQDVVTRSYYDAGRLAQDYFTSMVDAEIAVRNFAATRDEGYLAPLGTDPPWQQDATDEVRAQLVVDPEAAQKMEAVEAAARAWHQDWAVPAIAQVRAGRPVTAQQSEQEAAKFGAFRRAYGDFLVVLRDGRADALERLVDYTTALFYAVLVSAIVAIATVAMLWGLLRRWVSIPVANLAEETRIVRRGRLDHEVSIDGPPEFVRLGADVEGMRRRLVDQIAAMQDVGREIADARARLEEQAAELQRSNRELEQFAYVASHDLQEPLRKVASFCQLLEKRYAGQLDERANQYIGFAVDGAKRMQRLINDLLEFSRVGRLVNDVTDVDLEECLGLALGNLELAREEADAEITWDSLPHVRGEAPLLTQVLQNLIGNALKFRAEGRRVKVHIGARRQGKDWEFCCSDNGIGIEPEYAERVFVIFQRLHPKDVYGGTGIGLAMCKKIIEHHGGRIWVDTESGEGTTIRWTLPAIDGVPEGGGGHVVGVASVGAADGGRPGDGARADVPTGVAADGAGERAELAR
jgi:signal transduction histidine kinase